MSSSKRILVVTDATKEELSLEAPLWAIQNLAKAGDTIMLLGVLHQVNNPMGYKFRIEPGMFGVNNKKQEDEIKNIFDSNKAYFAQLKKKCESEQIEFSTAITPGFPVRSVLFQAATYFSANWIVLDRCFKKEKNQVSEHLHCSLAIIDKTGTGKVIQFAEPNDDSEPSSDYFDLPGACVTEASSMTMEMTDSLFSYTPSLLGDETSCEVPHKSTAESTYSDEFFSGHGILSKETQPFQVPKREVEEHLPSPDEPVPPIPVQPRRAAALDMLKLLDEQDSELEENPFATVELEERMLQELGTAPLCSLCNNKSPRFGTKPVSFPFSEVEEATNKFSTDNLLAEGGFGFVYKGKLKDGQMVAVKQHKLASTQGDREFSAEVEVLSSAQHRNLVTLIGYCVEGGRKILVYEYVCNNSLHWHLLKSSIPLDWPSRQKIALGAARGLRYLHEECRIGCIVHRDMRPNNILVTHDFSALVGDFGLARWQARGDEAEKTRVIGTIGYVAPEYAESGQITDKADVFSFGLVLLELITGKPAFDHGRSEHLLEWALPLLESRATHELVDARLDELTVDRYELVNMVNAAHQCIQEDPAKRPRMSQVVKILEGEDTDTTPLSPLELLDPVLEHTAKRKQKISYSEMLR